MRYTCLLEAMPPALHLNREPTVFSFFVASFYLLWSKFPFFDGSDSFLLASFFFHFAINAGCQLSWSPIQAARKARTLLRQLLPCFFSIRIGWLFVDSNPHPHPHPIPSIFRTLNATVANASFVRVCNCCGSKLMLFQFCVLRWQRKISFWFATGGAGFCLSRSLALKMKPLARYFLSHGY